MKLKLRAKYKTLAQARQVGANPASRKRDLDYAKCTLVKCGLLTMDVVMTSCPKESALMKRFVHKAKHTITVHTANSPIVMEDVANV